MTSCGPHQRSTSWLLTTAALPLITKCKARRHLACGQLPLQNLKCRGLQRWPLRSLGGQRKSKEMSAVHTVLQGQSLTVSQGRFPGGRALKWVLSTGHGVAQHVSSEGTVAGCGDTLETISTLPSLPFSAPHYSSPPTCGPASHLPAFCLPLHLLSLFFFFFLAFFFPVCFSPGGGPQNTASFSPVLAPCKRLCSPCGADQTWPQWEWVHGGAQIRGKDHHGPWWAPARTQAPESFEAMKLASCTWLIFWSSFFPASGKLAPIFGSLQNELSCLKLLLCIHLQSLSTSPAPSSMIFSHIVLCVFCFSPHTPSTTTHTHTHDRKLFKARTCPLLYSCSK